MKKLFALFTALLGSASSNGQIEEGQQWTYETRSNEPQSFLVIRKIEKDERLGDIVHISVFAVRIPNGNSPRGITNIIGHLPFSKEALLPCLKERKEGANNDTSWKEGYEIWKEAFDAGKAGVFTISVKESVDFMEQTLNQ